MSLITGLCGFTLLIAFLEDAEWAWRIALRIVLDLRCWPLIWSDRIKVLAFSRGICRLQLKLMNGESLVPLGLCMNGEDCQASLNVPADNT